MARAAPVRPPRRNDRMMLDAAVPRSSLIDTSRFLASSGVSSLEQTQLDPQVLARIAADVGDQAPEVLEGGVEVVVQLGILEHPPGASLAALEPGQQRVEARSHVVHLLEEGVVLEQSPG